MKKPVLTPMKNACCQTSHDDMFDQKKAKTDLNDYLKKGVKKSSRPLINATLDLPLSGKTLLDIGGGIGAISFELFKKGIKKSTHIDISKAYIQTFVSEARRRSMEDKIIAKQGDFLALADQVESADIVTLDKVICCYGDYEGLVQTSISKANCWYAYTVPRSVWWVKLVNYVDQFIQKFRKIPFKMFIHPTKSIEEMVKKAGFKKIKQFYQREWLIVLFEREA